MTPEKLSERIYMDYMLTDICHSDILRRIKEIEALEEKLKQANDLCVKLANQKGAQVDEMRELRAERDTFKKNYDRDSEWWSKTNIVMGELKERAEKAEAEVKRLEGELSAANQLNHDLDYCAEREEMGRNAAKAKLIKTEDVINKFHCPNFSEYPITVKCGTDKTFRCKSYWFCQAMKEALGVDAPQVIDEENPIGRWG